MCTVAVGEEYTLVRIKINTFLRLAVSCTSHFQNCSPQTEQDPWVQQLSALIVCVFVDINRLESQSQVLEFLTGVCHLQRSDANICRDISSHEIESIG